MRPQNRPIGRQVQRRRTRRPADGAQHHRYEEPDREQRRVPAGAAPEGEVEHQREQRSECDQPVVDAHAAEGTWVATPKIDRPTSQMNTGSGQVERGRRRARRRSRRSADGGRGSPQLRLSGGLGSVRSVVGLPDIIGCQYRNECRRDSVEEYRRSPVCRDTSAGCSWWRRGARTRRARVAPCTNHGRRCASWPRSGHRR
jgi:hypothetical protein